MGDEREHRVGLERHLGRGRTTLVKQAFDDAAVLHIAREKAQRQPRRLAPAHAEAAVERSAGRRQQHVALAIKRQQAHVLQRLVVEIGEARFERAVIKATLDLDRGVRKDFQRHQRVHRQERIGDERRHRHRGRNNAKTEAAGKPLPHFGELLAQRILVGENALRPDQNAFAFRREALKARSLAVDQGDSQLMLELAHRFGQRRLRDIAGRCGAGVIALAGQSDEVAEMADVHKGTGIRRVSAAVATDTFGGAISPLPPAGEGGERRRAGRGLHHSLKLPPLLPRIRSGPSPRFAGRGDKSCGTEQEAIALLRRDPRRRIDRLDLGGAELELRNLAERIKLRIGQQVRRRFHISERDEHHAIRHRVVLAREQLDRAAARRHAHRIARLNAELLDRAARKLSDRRRLQRVEHSGSTRHRAGVPMLELAAGRKDERILRVRHFVRRLKLRRDKLREAARAREAVVEHDIAARHVRPIDRIGDGVLARDAIPGDVVQRRHHRRHLVEHLADMLVVPAAPEPVGNLGDDPEILARVARQRDRGAAHLHLAVGVGHRAVLLRPAGGRQHDVGINRGLGEEEILHHEMLEMRQRLAGVVEVRVRHRRVLALDVHALDLVGVDRVHDLDDGFATLRRQLHAPRLFVLGADVRILDRLVVGEEHRDQTRVGRALHVVLAAQRMQTRTRTADLAGDERERNETARVVGAVRVLRHAHAPEDDRAFGAGIGARHFTKCVGVDAADRRHFLGRELLDVFLPGVEALDVGLDVLLVVELFLDDHVQHGVEHRNVRAVLELHHLPGVALHRRAARVHDDELGATLRRLLEEGGSDRVVLGRVRADHDDQLGILALVEGGGHRRRADAFEQRRHRRGVAEARAMVDVVGAEAGADQLLEQVRLFIRTLGGAEAGQRVGAVAVADCLEARSGTIERLFPGGLAEVRPRIRRIDELVRHLRHAVLADHRLQQALRIGDVIEAEAALHAEPVGIRRAVLADDGDDLVVLDLVGELAADAAVRADRVHRAVGLAEIDVVLVDHRRGHQRAGRARLHAFTAGDAGRLAHRVVKVEHDLLVVAAEGHADDIVDLHFAAGTDAEIAVDAGVEVHRHRDVAAVRRRHFVLLALREAAGFDLLPVDDLPELGVRIVRDLHRRLVG